MPHNNRIFGSPPRRWTALLALQAVLVTATGCNDTKPYFTPERQAEDIAYGKKMYSENGCSRCHSINGVGEHVGPDLTHIGVKHNNDTVEGGNWLYKQISEPNSHNPSSPMPAYKDKMDNGSISKLTDYLGSLK